MKTTASNLSRWAGLAAMGAGVSFVVIQAIHPLDVLASVSTPRWAIVHYLGVVMGLLGLWGITGIYARQAQAAGWLGFAGYLLFTIFFVITTAFQFVEAFISPLLVSVAPQFVEGLLGIASGRGGGMDMGALSVVYALNGFAGYMLGGVLLGVATVRARVLPRGAGILLASAAVLPLVAALPFIAVLFPHPLDRIFAVPMALAWAWLGYALWSERQAPASQPARAKDAPQLRPANAE
jgi:hypothetical protein